MFEKVNPSHPDKVADRIAGALVDIAYLKTENPKIAVEILIGHGVCHIIAETSVHLTNEEVQDTVSRIAGNLHSDYFEVPQDAMLAENQNDHIRCGDNGIFKGVPVTDEQRELTQIARFLYDVYSFDGKYIIDGDHLVLCQSHAETEHLKETYPTAIINPLGDWTGGTDVDSGATNRKLGSDMGDSITGGGLHGKDLSKADVSINIYAWLKAQETGNPVELCCAIGDDMVDGVPYKEIVEKARGFIKEILDHTVTFHFRDGHSESRDFLDKRHGTAWTPERREKAIEAMKAAWTGERKEAMSERIKKIRSEKKWPNP